AEALRPELQVAADNQDVRAAGGQRHLEVGAEGVAAAGDELGGRAVQGPPPRRLGHREAVEKDALPGLAGEGVQVALRALVEGAADRRPETQGGLPGDVQEAEVVADEVITAVEGRYVPAVPGADLRLRQRCRAAVRRVAVTIAVEPHPGGRLEKSL